MEAIAVISAASTVAQTGKIAWQIGEAIYVFIRDAKVIDETLDALQSEVTSFGDACEMLRTLLTGFSDTEKKRIESEDGQFWAKIDRAVREYARTVAQLGDSISTVENTKSRLFKQGRKQAKLNLKSQDMLIIRRRLSSHLSSVQMIVLTLNLRISLFTSRIADLEALKLGIESLREKKATVQASVQGDRRVSSPDKPKQLDENTAALVEIAKQVLGNATTVYSSSVASGSVIGNAHIEHVSTWLSGMDPVDSAPPLSDTSAEITTENSIFSQRNESRTSFTELSSYGSTTLEKKPVIAWASVEDSDDTDLSEDDDVEIKVAHNAVAAGRKAFSEATTQAQFKAARAALREGVSLAQELPMKQRLSIFDPWELRYQLAICAFMLDPASQSEAILLDVLRQNPTSNEQRRNVFNIYHLLAQLYASTGNLETARQSCKNALRGRRKLLGEEHEECFESLALMKRLFELRGAPVRAQAYLDIVPIAERRKYATMFEQLKPTSPAGNSDVKPTSPAPAPLEEQENERLDSPPSTLNQTPSQSPIQATRSALHEFSTLFTPPTPAVPKFQHERFDSQAGNESLATAIAQERLQPETVLSKSPTSPELRDSASLAGSEFCASEKPSISEERRPNMTARSRTQPPLGTSRSAPASMKVRSRWLDRLMLYPANSLPLDLADITRNNMHGSLALSGKGSVDAGPTSLHLAALFSDLSSASDLIKRGAKLDAQCSMPLYYQTPSLVKLQPIHLAAATHCPEMIEMLVSSGAPIAGFSGYCQLVDLLLHPGWIDLVHCSHTENRKSAYTDTRAGRDRVTTDADQVIDCFVYLQSIGFDPHERLLDGSTALHKVLSLQEDSQTSLPSFMKKFSSQTPVKANIMEEHFVQRIADYIVQSVTKTKEDIRFAKDSEDSLPIHVACITRNLSSSLEMLFEGLSEEDGKRQVNSTNRRGLYPLQLLASNAAPDPERLSMLRLLLEKGASPKLVEASGRKIIDLTTAFSKNATYRAQFRSLIERYS